MQRTTPESPAPGAAPAIVTDLDGCLLDPLSYGFAPARATLRRIRRLGVPLVLCTSKTRSEVRALWAAMRTRHIAVVEDGGAIVVPPGAASAVPLPGARRTSDGRVVALTTRYGAVRRAFLELRRLTGGAAVGMGDMTTDELMRRTGLPRAAALRAARREHDEPFVLLARETRWEGVARRLARRHGLVLTRGSRFFHLHGPSDKGRAVRLVRAILEARAGPLVIVAVGDSPLDASFLRDAEVPIIVPRADGRPDPVLCRRIRGARIAPAPGPAGWARAVDAVLREFGRRRAHGGPGVRPARGGRSRPGRPGWSS